MNGSAYFKKNMKKFFTFVVCLFLFKNSYTQSNDNGQIDQYYKLVNSAHVHICKTDWESANQDFSEAFKKIPYPFFVDLNNAVYAQVNSTYPDEKAILHYLKKIQFKGVCVHERYKHLDKYLKYTQQLEHTACRIADSNEYVYINKLLEADQLLRKYSSAILNTPYSPVIMPSIKTIDSLNFLLLDSLLRTPSKFTTLEERIGYHGIEHAFFVILLHNGPWCNVNDSFLSGLVMKGDMENRLFINLMDHFCTSEYFTIPLENKQFKKEKGCTYSHGIYGTLIYENINDEVFFIRELESKEWEEIVNKRRREYFLNDVYEDAKIVAYMAFNRDKGIGYRHFRFYKSSLMKEGFEKNYKGTRYIKYLNAEDYDFDRPFTVH